MGENINDIRFEPDGSALIGSILIVFVVLSVLSSKFLEKKTIFLQLQDVKDNHIIKILSNSYISKLDRTETRVPMYKVLCSEAV